MEKKISRRDFIRLAGITAGAGVLAACATPTAETIIQTVEVEKVVKETEIVEKSVEKVVTATAVPATEAPPAVMDVWFNTNIPDLQCRMESLPLATHPGMKNSPSSGTSAVWAGLFSTPGWPTTPVLP